MGSFLGRLGNYRDSLTPNEGLVADYLASNPEKGLLDSIQQIAEQTGVSIASVSRLASTLGYKDWKELRASLSFDSNHHENPVLADVEPGDDDGTIARKVFNSNIASLHDTLEQMDMPALTRVAKAVAETDRVVFFGSGGSGCIARDESLRFAHLEMSAEAYMEEFQMMLQAARMTREQVAFGFSNSGRSRTVVEVMIEARRNGALTVGIANFRNTPLEQACDVFFCTSFPKRGEMTAALTARIATQSIMDTIYVIAAQRGRVSKRVEHVDSLLEAKLRIQPNNRSSPAKSQK